MTGAPHRRARCERGGFLLLERLRLRGFFAQYGLLNQPVIGGGFASICETTPDNLHLTHGNDYFYIQVAMSIADRDTEEREYRALSSAKDHYPQYLFTLDTLLQKRDGVRHVNIIDFITEGRDL